MKRTERHHLKQNELATRVETARETLTQHGRTIVVSLVVVAVVLVGWAGYTFWRERGNQQAAGLMSEAMTIMQARVVSPAAPDPSKPAAPATPPEAGTYPTETAKREAALPKFLAAADAYPNTALGLAARYHAASLLTALGRLPEAEQRYGEVIDRAGTGIYAEMARMGRAEVQAMAGKHKEAIAAWEELSKKTTSEVPQDAVLLQLARTYKLAGRPDDAMKTYQRVIDEFPTSPFGADARQELDALKTAPQVAQR